MIEIDLQTIVPPGMFVRMVQASVEAVLADVAEAARHEWIRVAQAELSTTRRDYVNGIQPVRFKPGVAVITLVGVLPNLIEKGMDEKDLHDTLLGSNVPVAPPGSRGKHPRKGGGYYRAIPFRHATPGTTGAVGVAMGKAYDGHAAVEDSVKLGKDVYNKAKKLGATTSDPHTGKMAYGGRLPKGLAPKLQDYHAVDIYAGMIRERKTYKSATQSQYMTFRMIAVDASGKGIGSSPWIRPRTPGREFVKKVDQFVRRIAPMAFEAYVESMK